MKVLLFISKGSELIELSAFIDVFGWDRHYNNGNIEIITCGFTKQIKSTFGLSIGVDILIDEIKIEEYAALAIPGGFSEYGFYDDAYNESFLELIRVFHRHGKIIASICVGALPIGKNGTTYHLMNGRRQNQLKEFGVKIINEPVVVYENIITSWCPATAMEVAFKLLEMLRTIEDSEKIRNIMGY